MVKELQYGLDIFPYKRIKKMAFEKKAKKSLDFRTIIKYTACFLICVSISRVKLINNTAPFGIAFIISTLMYLDKKTSFAAGAGAVLGYLTLIGQAEHIPAYIVIIAAIYTLNHIADKLTKIKKISIIMSMIMLILLVNNLFVANLDLGIAFFSTLLEIICIIPLYFILDYGIVSFKEVNSKHLFNNEEIVSMGIIISLMVAGTWGITVHTISIMNILGIFVVLGISYICGSAAGAAAGVAMGVIVGMSSSNMLIFISMYGVCGLVTGIFKETGKWMSGIACFVAFLIIKIYGGINGQFKLIEIIMACTIYFLIPQKIYTKLSLDINPQKKRANISKNYINKIKNLYLERLNDFSGLLFNMSNILNNLVDNEKLSMKSKSSALIENLADRVCSNCNMRTICWKRELHYTYSAFGELIQNYQQKKYVIPSEIERKCIKRTPLIKNTEDIVNKYIISEMRRTSLSEGREVLANQIFNMANSVKEIIEEFNCDISINTSVEEDIKKIFDKNKIKYNEILCVEDKRGGLSIKLTMKACGGKQLCIKEALPLINEVTGKCMCVAEEGCKVDPISNLCGITFEETPKYHVATYAAKRSKDGEECNGDSYSYSKLNDGTFMSIISDGMGSGPRAGRESTAAVELLNKFTGAGFSKLTAINAVNSVMTMKFSEEEKFSTVDLSSIDLYTGDAEFMKVGAVPSFIKSTNNIEVIKSKTLPIGVLDKVDIDIQKKKIKSGDLIVMISDGVLDYNDSNIGKLNWIVEYLEKTKKNNPKEVASGLLNEAIKLRNNKVKDDMTILVSKVYCLY